MDPPVEQEAGQPRVRVTQVACARSGGDWRMVWRIVNLTSAGIRFLDARFPHGQFHSGLMELVGVQAAPSGSTHLEAVVTCNGDHGDVVENAFLITTVEWQEARWRILARMTVRFTAGGGPAAETELVTAQRVGFSEPASSAGPQARNSPCQTGTQPVSAGSGRKP